MRTIVKGKNIEVPDRIARVRRAQAARASSGSSTIGATPSSSSPSSSTAAPPTPTSSRSPSSSTARRCGRHAAAINHRAGVDEVVDKLERRAVDHREKPRVRARPDEEKQLLRQIADGTAERRRERRIVKTKRFAIEPMFEEDAIARMEELGHQFFVFVNAETERVDDPLPARDGDFGLIEPVVGGEYTKGRAKADYRSNGRR